MSMTPEQAFDKAQTILMQLNKTIEQASQARERVDCVERNIFAVLLELGQQLLRGFVAMAGDGDVGDTWQGENATLRKLSTHQTKTYRSIFGVIKIDRCVYAVRQGQKTYSPLDQQLGLPAGEQSYVLEDWLQRFCVQDAFGTAIRNLNDLLGTQASKRTAERINQEMSQYVDAFRETQPCPHPEEEEEILVVTADGKGVPMRSTLEDRMGLPELAWRRHQRKKQEAKADQRATKRLSVGQVSVGKQMAYVGAVYTIARWRRNVEDIIDEIQRKAVSPTRPVPKNKRVQAQMTCYDDEGERQDGQPTLFEKLASEAIERNELGLKTLVCLMDGQRSLWNMQQQWFPEAVCIVDIFHVMEKLWEIAYCFHKQGSRDAENYVTHLLEMLLTGKVSSMIGVLKRKRKSLTKPKQERLDKLLTYFRNNKQSMRYDVYLAEGYPIGSGVVEGACRHLVRDRMEKTGMRWEIQGAQAMLNTRSTYINNQWNDFVEFRIEQEQKRLYGQAA